MAPSNNETTWSKTEKRIAREAYDKAYEREVKAIEQEVRSMLDKAQDARVVWRIHDFLSERRVETDRKYDYRYSVLLGVFGHLLAEGWLHLDDIEGLDAGKIEKIRAIADFRKQNI